MEGASWFQNKIDSLKEDFDFKLEKYLLEITEKICGEMQKKGINRTELAEILGVSRPAVSKILNGNSNFTLKTLLALSEALEMELRVDLAEKKSAPLYFEKVTEIKKSSCFYPVAADSGMTALIAEASNFTYCGTLNEKTQLASVA